MTPKDPRLKFLGKFEVIFPEEIYSEKKLSKIFERVSRLKTLEKIPTSLEVENLEDIISRVVPNKKYEVNIISVLHSISCTSGWETLLEEKMLPINFSELFFILERLPLDTTIFLPNDPYVLPRLLEAMTMNDRVFPGILNTLNKLQIVGYDLYEGSIIGESSSKEKSVLVGLKEV